MVFKAAGNERWPRGTKVSLTVSFSIVKMGTSSIFSALRRELLVQNCVPIVLQGWVEVDVLAEIRNQK
jgi:hypothetical protein